MPDKLVPGLDLGLTLFSYGFMIALYDVFEQPRIKTALLGELVMATVFLINMLLISYAQKSSLSSSILELSIDPLIRSIYSSSQRMTLGFVSFFLFDSMSLSFP